MQRTQRATPARSRWVTCASASRDAPGFELLPRTSLLCQPPLTIVPPPGCASSRSEVGNVRSICKFFVCSFCAVGVSLVRRLERAAPSLGRVVAARLAAPGVGARPLGGCPAPVAADALCGDVVYHCLRWVALRSMGFHVAAVATATERWHVTVAAQSKHRRRAVLFSLANFSFIPGSRNRDDPFSHPSRNRHDCSPPACLPRLPARRRPPSPTISSGRRRPTRVTSARRRCRACSALAARRSWLVPLGARTSPPAAPSWRSARRRSARAALAFTSLVNRYAER